MKTFNIHNSTLSSEDFDAEIKAQNITLKCSSFMQLVASDEDFQKLCSILDPNDITNVAELIEGKYISENQVLYYELDGKKYKLIGEFEISDTGYGYDVLHWHEDDILVVAHIKL